MVIAAIAKNMLFLIVFIILSSQCYSQICKQRCATSIVLIRNLLHNIILLRLYNVMILTIVNQFFTTYSLKVIELYGLAANSITSVLVQQVSGGSALILVIFLMPQVEYAAVICLGASVIICLNESFGSRKSGSSQRYHHAQSHAKGPKMK